MKEWIQFIMVVQLNCRVVAIKVGFVDTVIRDKQRDDDDAVSIIHRMYEM